MKKVIGKILCDQWRLLTFRSIRPEVSLYRYYLAFALLICWLCGVGRYWDNDRAVLFQYLGLGSVVYVFVLSWWLWIVARPLKPENWTYLNVLLFVSMTSPPALLYAIPVERYFSMSVAVDLNVMFLGVVALWRVLLYMFYLYRAGKLTALATVVVCFLQLTLIVAVLAALNLEHVVFRIMGGLTDAEMSGNDGAFVILLALTLVSIFAAPLLLIIYLWLVFSNNEYWRKQVQFRKLREKKEDDLENAAAT